MLFLTALTTMGWSSLDKRLPWPLVTAAGIVIVFMGSALLTALLARLPGARGTAGIPRRPWRAKPAANVLPVMAPLRLPGVPARARRNDMIDRRADPPIGRPQNPYPFQLACRLTIE